MPGALGLPPNRRRIFVCTSPVQGPSIKIQDSASPHKWFMTMEHVKNITPGAQLEEHPAWAMLMNIAARRIPRTHEVAFEMFT